MRRARATAALAAVGLAGCGLGGGGPEGGTPAGTQARRPAAPDPAAELRDLLARRAEALRRGDGRALAATAGGAQRARDRRAARRARRLGLRRVELRVDALDVRGDRARLRVAMSYRLRGVRGSFTSRRRLAAVRDDDGWRVVRSGGARQQPPWEAGEFRRRVSRHFVLLAPPAVDVSSSGLVDALEAGYARIRTLLRSGTLRRRYLVVVARDARQARRLTARIRGLEGLAALTDTEVRQEGSAERVATVASQRLLVVWPAFLEVGREERARVVAHELTHAAVAPATSGRTPYRLLEGLALYVSGDRRVAQAAELLAGGATGRAARRALTLSSLSDPDAIALLRGDAQAAAYAYSSSAAHYIVDSYGRRALLDLYDAFNDEGLPGRAGDPRLADRATREILDVGLARLERDLRRWIVTRAVVDPDAP